MIKSIFRIILIKIKIKWLSFLFFFRKPKKVELQIFHFDGSFNSALKIQKWSEEKVICDKSQFGQFLGMIIPEKNQKVVSGDYVMKGDKNDFFVCKPQTYEKYVKPILEKNEIQST